MLEVFAGAVLSAGMVFADIILISPKDRQEVELQLPAQREISKVATHADRVSALKRDAVGEKRLLKCNEWRRSADLTLSWKVTNGEHGPWKVILAKAGSSEKAVCHLRQKPVNAATGREESGPADVSVVTVTIPRANLELGETYEWQVEMHGNCGKFGCGPNHACGLYTNVVRSSVATFRTESEAPRWIALEGRVGNVRDLGGWRTADGRRVRQGMAYRGQGLNDNSVSGERPGANRLTVEDVKFLTQRLGIVTDLDLRGKDELGGLAESPLGPEVKLVHNPSESYRDIFTEKGRAAMARNVRLFCDPKNYPIYFHCIGGADRTGALAYVLNAVLGVLQHDLEIDWESTFYPTPPDVWPEYTGPDYWCNLCHLDNGFAQYGGPEAPIREKVEKYLVHCGVTPEEIARLRSILIDDDAPQTESGSRSDPRPFVWWHWTGTAVTKEGIVRDLDAMLDAGIGGATIFQVARGPCSETLAEGYEDDAHPALEFGNDAWCELVAFAAHEAKVRGLEIGMHNCPGYTVSGGPWITPELAMKKLVWTSAAKGTRPPQPETNLGFYREIGTVDVGATTYRFGYTCTGSQCMPVAKSLWGRCLEADKMSAKAVNLHLDKVLRRPLGLDFILMDSYEAGPYDWTDDFRAEFAKRRGYDPLALLPAYVGAVDVGAEKIKADMALTVKELSTERHYWVFRDRLHAVGLKFVVEPYGGPFDAAEAAWASDIPTTEFWGCRPFWVAEGEIGAHPQVGGAAGRAAGRTILAAEAFTAMPFDDPYVVSPRDLKACADASFARGVNRMLLHHWVHQPFPACRKPGNSMGYWGTHFGENQTWYEPGKAFFRYLRDCQDWLQRGEQVVDVLAVGEGFGNCDDVDVVPRRIYETDTERKDGKVRIVSSGRTYSQVCFSPQDLKVPRRPFAVVSGVPVTANGPVLGTARVERDGTRFFFVANVSTNRVSFVADFRATGVPEFRFPETGRAFAGMRADAKDGYSRLPLVLRAQESVVVVFRQSSDLPRGAFDGRLRRRRCAITGPWTVSFEAGRGAPTEPVVFSNLVSFAASSDPRIRYFSGTATYRTRVVLQLPPADAVLALGDVRDIARVRVNGRDLGVAWHCPFEVRMQGALKTGENEIEIEVTNGWHNRLLGDRTLPDDCEWGPKRRHQCAMDGAKGFCGRGIRRIPDWAWRQDGARPSSNRVAFTVWDYFQDGDRPVDSGMLGPVAVEW